MTKELASIITEIKDTASRNAKEELISRHKDNKDFIDVLQCVFSPYNKSNIGMKSLNTAIENTQYDGKEYDIMDCVDMILKGEMTSSNECLELCAQTVLAQEEEHQELAKRIIAQDMPIGAGVSTINKGLGYHLIDEIKPMLGTSMDKATMQGHYIATEKHDGVRRLVVVKRDGITAFSRNGIINELPEGMKEEFKKLPYGVYDGEMLAVGEFKDNHAHRQATNALVSRKELSDDIEFIVFDYISLEDFFEGRFKYKALDRKIRAISALNEELPAWLKLTPQQELSLLFNNTDGMTFKHIRTSPLFGIVSEPSTALALASAIWEQGGEGIMLLKADSTYTNGRTKDLLKVKNRQGYDLPIVDFIEGEGQFKGMLGAFIVDYKGHRVGVGTGLTQEQRAHYWQRREELLGTIIEIESFGETQDVLGNTSLNCAVFKGLRPDKDE